MPLALPDLTFLKSQLNGLGQAAKSAGPSLFSETQAAGPVSPQKTSMMTDFMDTKLQGSLNPQSWKGQTGSLNPTKPEGMSGPQNPYYNPGPSSGSGGPVGSLGGEYSVLDQYDSYFQEASAATGIPVNTLKAIAATERGWEGNSVSGAVGIMQVMPGIWGHLGDLYDPRSNIMVGAKVLKSNLDQYGDMNTAIRAYLGFGTDAYGTSDGAYLQRVLGFQQQLDANGGSFAGGDLGSVFQNGTVPDWGEFGVESDNGYYSYGRDYGMNGTQHTGADVPMAVGTAYRAPTGGIVTCGGTGNGPGADGGGCSAFGDYYGNGAGRVEVLLDNGAVLIFGHSSTSAFQPGQRFNAGDVLGTSGGMNSPHIHLEARVKDPSTPSGWRIVDPRTVIGGGGISGGASYGSGQQQANRSIGQQISDFYARYR